MALKLLEGPIIEPCTVDEVKTFLRIDVADDDEFLALLIKAAVTDVEHQLNRALVSQQWQYYLDRFPCTRHIDMPKPPLISVEGITYTDAAGVADTPFAETNYEVDIISTPGRIVLVEDASWPATKVTANCIKIEFTCGTEIVPGEGEDPATVEIDQVSKVAILLRVAHYYKNRGQAIEELLRAGRMFRF